MSGFRQSANELRMLPGESVPVSGPAGEGVHSPQDLHCAADSDLIRLIVRELDTGFWLGGLMWRGELTTDSDIVAGDYTVTVGAKGEPTGKPFTVFRVRVFGDAASLLESSASMLQRHTGISPWWFAAFFFPLTFGFAGFVYLCSQKREQILRQEGKAEIYHVTRKDDAYEVSFALGTRHGVRSGSVLTILDKTGLAVGSVTVGEVYEEDATAVTTSGCVPEPGFIVALP